MTDLIAALRTTFPNLQSYIPEAIKNADIPDWLDHVAADPGTNLELSSLAATASVWLTRTARVEARGHLQIAVDPAKSPFAKLKSRFPNIREKDFIKSVLVANNGMAARKIIKDVRDFASEFYGDPYAIKVVVMATKADIANRMAYIKEADEVIVMDPPHGVQPYGIVDLIADLAEKHKIDAVHPGWGWASELSMLPKALAEKGVRFLGPDAESMDLLGSKANANILFQSVDTSGAMARWSGDGITINVDAGDSITPEILAKVTINSREQAKERARKVGYPIMAKVSDAGGGRGMHFFFNEEDFDIPPPGSDKKDKWSELVTTASNNGSNIFLMQLALQRDDVDAIQKAQKTAREYGYPVYLKLSNKIVKAESETQLLATYATLKDALSTMQDSGDDTSKIEILGGGQRHIEIQVLADEHGNALSLYPRDCSGQIANQKRSEELADIDPEIAKKLMSSATAIARASGYKSAATVEFLVDPNGSSFIPVQSSSEKPSSLTFLEVNTRVQVEHPVTEGYTNIDIIQTQLLLKQGVKLNEVPAIRAYYFGAMRANDDSITMEDIQSRMLTAKPKGHTIAFRVTAEDPSTFRFSPGKIYHQRFQGDRHSWFYSAYEEGGNVSPDSDSQIGHLFVWGETREEAIKNSRQALARLEVFGTLKTNIAFLRWLVEQDEFVEYGIHNRLLEQWKESDRYQYEVPDFADQIISSVAVRAFEDARDPKKIDAKGKIGSSYKLIINDEWHTFFAYQTGPHTLALVKANDPTQVIEAKVHSQGTGVSYDVIINGKKRTVLAQSTGEVQKLQINGIEVETKLAQEDPSRITSPMSGKILEILIKGNDKVKPGQIIIKLWANKTEQEIRSLVEAVVEKIEVIPGESVQQGAALVKLAGVPEPKKLAESTKTIEAEKPDWLRANLAGHPEVFEDVLSHIFDNYAYPVPDKILQGGFETYLKYLSSKDYWLDQVSLFIWAHRPHMPEPLFADVKELLSDLRTADSWQGHEAAVNSIRVLLQTHNAGLNAKKELTNGKSDFVKLFEQFVDPKNNPQLSSPVFQLANKLVQSYYAKESEYQKVGLRNPQSLALAQKNILLKCFLEHLNDFGINWQDLAFSHGGHAQSLRSLLRLESADYNPVLSQVEKLVMSYTNHVSYPERKAKLEAELTSISSKTGHERIKAIEELVTASQPIFDVLLPLMLSSDEKIQKLATLIYLRRTYRTYETKTQRVDGSARALKYKYASEKELNRFVYLDTVSSWTIFEEKLSQILDEYPEESAGIPLGLAGNRVLKLVIDNRGGVFDSADDQAEKIEALLTRYYNEIAQKGIKRLSVIVLNKEGDFPMQYSFRVKPGENWLSGNELMERFSHLDFADDRPVVEDKVYRGLEPPLAYTQLDYDLLKNFSLRRVDTPDSSVYIYDAIDKKSDAALRQKRSEHSAANKDQKKTLGEDIKRLEMASDTRLFARTMVRHLGAYENRRFTGIDEAFNRLISNLRVARREVHRTFNEIYVNILPALSQEALTPETATRYIEKLIAENSDQLTQLQVQKVEFKASIKRSDGALRYYRVIALSHGGAWQDVTFYEESYADQKVYLTPLKDHETIANKMVRDEDSSIVLEPYKVLNKEERRRKLAESLATTYVYDWPKLFEDAVEDEWVAAGFDIPKDVIKVTELYLNDEGQMLYRDPVVGGNIDLSQKPNGAVAFRLTIKTPEYPEGRDQIIVINNDVNVDRGPYGPLEATLFVQATRLAIRDGIPHLSIQSNIGAQFDIEDVVVKNFKSATSLLDPSKGFEPKNVRVDYVYFTEEFWAVNQDKLSKGVTVEQIIVNGETRYKITAVPGLTEGLDADSLNYSGLMAGISDEAFEKIVSSEYTTGYGSIGIGSYKARLLHRVYLLNGVLKKGYLILTGHGVLNGTYDRDERTGYSSNLDTAGPDIMLENGVAYWGPKSDLDFVRSYLRRLARIPKDTSALPPVLITSDMPDRKVKRAVNEAEAKSVLRLIEEISDTGFDSERDFILKDYARTVVGADISLGGRSWGFVGVELDKDNAFKKVPGDKLVDGSKDTKAELALRLLTADGSFKISELINMFNREGRPVFLMIDWQGFSAGTTEMFNQVLKYGSMIVTALRKAQVPVFAYFTPGSELRGGSWVVFDRNINRDGRIWMAADTTARGGVLQPNQVITVKGKKRIPELISRLIPEYQNMIQSYWDSLSEDQIGQITEELKSIAAQDQDIQSVCLQLLKAKLVEELAQANAASVSLPQANVTQRLKDQMFAALAEVQKGSEALRDVALNKIEFDPENKAQVAAVLRVLENNKSDWEALLGNKATALLAAAKAKNEGQAVVLADLATTALQEIVRLQQVAEAMKLKGTIDAVVPVEDVREAAYIYGERELHVLDLERAIIKEAPTLKRRDVVAALDQLRDFIKSKNPATSAWREEGFLRSLNDKKRTILNAIAAAKHAKAVREAMAFNPVAALRAVVDFLSERGLDSNALSGLVDSAALLQKNQTTVDQYIRIMDMAPGLGYERTLDSDEENPEFMGADGRKVMIGFNPLNKNQIVIKDVLSGSLTTLDVITGLAEQMSLSRDRAFTLDSVVELLGLNVSDAGQFVSGAGITLNSIKVDADAGILHIIQDVDDILDVAQRVLAQFLAPLLKVEGLEQIKVTFAKTASSLQDVTVWDRVSNLWVQNTELSSSRGSGLQKNYEAIKSHLAVLEISPDESSSPASPQFKLGDIWLQATLTNKILTLNLEEASLDQLRDLTSKLGNLNPDSLNKVIVQVDGNKRYVLNLTSGLGVWDGQMPAGAGHIPPSGGTALPAQSILGNAEPVGGLSGAAGVEASGVGKSTENGGKDGSSGGTPTAMYTGDRVSDLGAQTLAKVYEFPNLLAEGVKFFADGNLALKPKADSMAESFVGDNAAANDDVEGTKLVLVDENYEAPKTELELAEAHAGGTVHEEALGNLGTPVLSGVEGQAVMAGVLGARQLTGMPSNVVSLFGR